MKLFGWLLLLMSLSGCWCCGVEEYDYTDLPEYTGPRDHESLKREILRRYDHSGLLIDGDARSYDPVEDDTHSFDLEVAYDRRVGGVALGGAKAIPVGSVFSFLSKPGSHVFTDYLVSPPKPYTLRSDNRLPGLGGATVGDLRAALFRAWPPARQDKIVVGDEAIVWGPWAFDPRSLALMEGRFSGWTWAMGRWEEIDGRWIAGGWTFRFGEAWLEVTFDVDDAELDWESDEGEFDP